MIHKRVTLFCDLVSSRCGTSIPYRTFVERSVRGDKKYQRLCDFRFSVMVNSIEKVTTEQMESR